MLYPLVLLIIVTETTAMGFLKQYSMTSSIASLAIGLACYMVVAFLLMESLQFEGMGIVNILWSAFSVIAVVITGILVFGEKISMLEVFGIAFVITGVVLLRSREATETTTGGQCLHLPANLPTSR